MILVNRKFLHNPSTYFIFDIILLLVGTEHNFAKYNNDTVTDFGVEYDYDSVMHYPRVAFSKNGNNTIIPLKVRAEINRDC